MGRSKTVPDRWLDYDDVGGIVPGTRFIAFKVPLRESICSRLPPNRRFTPNHLMERIYGLGLVIDLTCTNRYYDPESLVSRGVIHVKIMCAGQQIPNADVVSDFFRTVDAFLTDPANDGKLIGVHCTHGVNRTGYLVCKYMIEKLRIAPMTAVEEFQNARGHRFDRDEYVGDLQRVDKPEHPSEFRRFDGQYVSNFQSADRQDHVRDFRVVGSSSSEPLGAAAQSPSSYAYQQIGSRYSGMPPQHSGRGVRPPRPMRPHFWQANGPDAAGSDDQYSVPYRTHSDGDTRYWRSDAAGSAEQYSVRDPYRAYSDGDTQYWRH